MFHFFDNTWLIQLLFNLHFSWHGLPLPGWSWMYVEEDELGAVFSADTWCHGSGLPSERPTLNTCLLPMLLTISCSLLPCNNFIFYRSFCPTPRSQWSTLRITSRMPAWNRLSSIRYDLQVLQPARPQNHKLVECSDQIQLHRQNWEIRRLTVTISTTSVRLHRSIVLTLYV